MRIWLCFLAAVSVGWSAENFTADYYRAEPARYTGKEIRLRVASVEGNERLSQLDPDFIWMQATTGRPKKEEGKIFLRVPKAEAEKLARMLNQPSSSGRLIEGKFFDRNSGPILPGAICQEAPFYLQTGASTGVADEGEAVSGSLVVAPRPKTTPVPVQPVPVLAAKPLPSLNPPPVSLTKPSRKQWVVCRSKSGGDPELKLGESVQLKDGVYEVKGPDGKLSVLGQASVIGVVPYPGDVGAVAADEAKEALRQYAELEKKEPGVTALLAESKGAWEKLATPAVAAASSKGLPELEEVETAAGVEEPV